jgi:hypothetical protein
MVNKKQFHSFSLLLLLFCCTPYLIYADAPVKRTRISYHEWYNKLRESSSGELVFTDCEFYDDSTEENIHNHKAKTIVVNCPVVLQNVLFDGSVLQKIIFNNTVTFDKIDGDIYWSNCTFKKLLRFNKIEGDVWFDTCSMDGIIWEPEEKSEDAFVRFNLCDFHPGAIYKAIYKPYSINSPLIIMGSNFESTRLEIDNSVFYDSQAHPIVLFSYTNFLDIYFEKNIFRTDVSFLNSTVSDNLEVVQCQFKKHVDFSGFNFPNPQTDFQYNQIASKIALSDDIESLPTKVWYKGEGKEEIGDTLWFNRLVASYYKLMALYKSRGDFESANACYIDIKNLELKRLNYEFQTHSSVNLWFSFGLNYFLRWFSDYGTNPSKALVFSFYTMLLFAGIYFFFPSQFSTAERFAVIKRIQWLIHYISSDHRIIELYQKNERHIAKEQVLHEFDQLLERKQNEIPFFIKIVAHPLRALSKIPNRISAWLLSKSDFAKGNWSEFSDKQKVTFSILLAIGLLFYLLQVFIVRCLSSLVLSLNVFSTLGFGAIPVKGLPRYLAIVQGFIGWFFLSIFSASLISQLLQ